MFKYTGSKVHITVASLLLASTSLAVATPKFTADAAANVSFDGLQRLDDSAMRMAWAKPDIDLSHYRKIMLQPAGITFRADTTKRRNSDEFPLTAAQKDHLRGMLLEVFAKELGKSTRFELTNQPGRDVLLIRGAVLDVVSHIPPEPVGRGAILLKSLGEATLVVELRDSMSDEILARAVDRRAASSHFMRRSNSVSNSGDIRSAAQQWANLLRRRLDEFASL